jgi:DNA invertase Pin-like site-specific DNA recombinase
MTSHHITSQRLGYERVPTLDQNLEAQADTLTPAGANKISIEKITGTKASRPELDKLRGKCARVTRSPLLVVTAWTLAPGASSQFASELK